uniref:Membrane protein n=1 Tax=Salmonella phage vB_SEnST11_KE22 TaxID=3161173 RepID=A0AAU8GHR6_9CAUD
MIYTIYAIFTVIGIILLARHWLSGEDFKMQAGAFSTFVCIAVVEGIMMVTTIIPPSHGLFAGILFGYWLFRHIISGRAILQEKLVPNKRLGIGVIVNIVFFGLVSLSYFGG